MVGINSNLIASSATRNLGAANAVVSGSVSRLSSGNRIIKASDDVAGLAIGTSIQSTVKTLEVALLNTQQASSVLGIADGALSQVGNILTRQASLASQANSGALSTTERSFINQEFQALVQEIDRIVGSTQFNGIALLDGSLAGAANTTVASTPTYSAVGTPGASVHADGVTMTSFADASYQGTGFGTFEVVQFIAEHPTNPATVLRTQIGEKTYIGTLVATDTDGLVAASADLVMTATDDSGSSFTINLAGSATLIEDGTAATALATALTTDLANVQVFQNRGLSSVNASAVTNTAAAGVGAVTILSNNFDTTNNAFGNVTSISGIAGATTENSLSMIINGRTFTASNIAGANSILVGGEEASIVLNGVDVLGNATGETITIATNGLTSQINFQNQDEVNTFVNALSGYLGLGSGSSAGGLSFQVGASTVDSISVKIQSVKTADIYKDGNNNYQVLDITTQEGAQQAAEVLANAISSVIGRRADVGAAISRFDFAASNLEVSIANQDAARGSFLDADVATESTNFATAQVKLQASVAVLAQANQLPATLLRLLQ